MVLVVRPSGARERDPRLGARGASSSVLLASSRSVNSWRGWRFAWRGPTSTRRSQRWRRSKGHWGDSAAFLESCRVELTFDAAECGSGRMWVADTGADVAGFGLVQGDPPRGQLAALFVDPSAIGTGLRRAPAPPYPARRFGARFHPPGPRRRPGGRTLLPALRRHTARKHAKRIDPGSRPPHLGFRLNSPATSGAPL